MTRLTDTQLQVRANAIALYDSAELLHEHGHYPRAVSLAILAIEECGKLIMLRHSDPAPKLRVHSEKQSIAGSRLDADILTRALDKFYGEHELELRSIKSLLKDPKWQGVTEEEIIKISDGVIKEHKVEEFMADVLYEHGDLEFVQQSKSGSVDVIKQNGFYVDIDKQGNIVSTPSDMGEEVSSEYLQKAKKHIDHANGLDDEWYSRPID